MADVLLTSPFLGLTLSAAGWCFGCWLQKKTGLLVCNPLLIASALIIALLSLFRIPYESYALGSNFIKLMLGPVTAVLALNIYNQRVILRENFLPVLAGCMAESGGGVGGIAAAAVIITGIIGTVFAPLFSKLFHITEPVAEGLAIGACSHALGTTRAMEIGPVQGAMSSIAICVCGIMTSILALFL